jgi:hypothetical protein
MSRSIVSRMTVLLNIGLACVFAAYGDVARGVSLSTPEISQGAVSAEFQARQLVDVAVALSAEETGGVLGGELALVAGSTDLAIHSISFAPAFSEGATAISPVMAAAVSADVSSNGPLGETGAEVAASATLPGSSYQTIRTQPADALDRTLGADGQPVQFATVTLEILNSRPFESSLAIYWRGAAIAPPVEDAAAASGEGGESIAPTFSDEVQRSVIKIVNTAPAPAPQPPADVWETANTNVTLTAIDPATGEAASTLIAGETYALHYDAQGEAVTGYALFVVAEDVGHAIASAVPPDDGPWGQSALFSFSDTIADYGYAPSADGYPNGFWRYAAVSDDLMLSGSAGAATGHLFDFVPESAGTLRMQMFMRRFDAANQRVVEPKAQVEFAVVE